MKRLERRFAVRLRFIGLVALAAAGLVVAATAAVAEDARLSVPPTVPAGFVDPAGATFFVTNANGNVEAVDLATGETLWESANAYRPLAVAGHKLIAQARVKDAPDTMRLVLLDLDAKGKLLKQSEEIIVGGTTEYDSGESHVREGGREGERLPVVQAHRTFTFSITATVEKGEAVVRWASRDRELPDYKSRRNWGRCRLDLDSGKVKDLVRGFQVKGILTGLDEGEETPTGSPISDPKVLEVPADLKSVPDTGAPWSRPWVTDGKGCLLLAKASKKNKGVPEAREITLYRWDLASGKTAEPVLLHDGPVAGGPELGLGRTPDGALIILVTNDEDRHHVFLFAAATGKRLADVDLKGRAAFAPITGKPAAVEQVAGGRTVLISDQAVEPRVVLLAAATGERLADLDRFKGPISVQVGGDGAAVTVTDKTHVLLLDAATGKQLADVPVTGPASVQPTADGKTLFITDPAHLLLLATATGKQLADVDRKGTTTTHLISEGRAVLIARPAEADKNVQHVTLLAAATGEKLGELDVHCGQELRIDDVVGVIGTRVYTAFDPGAVKFAPGKGGGVELAVLTAFDAARGEVLWKKGYNSRCFMRDDFAPKDPLLKGLPK
jgi:outer membrane protein assembly factor BamB